MGAEGGVVVVVLVGDGRAGTFLRWIFFLTGWYDMSILCPSTEQCSASRDQRPESSAVGFARYGCKISLKYRMAQHSCSHLYLLITCQLFSVKIKHTGGGAVVSTVASMQEGCDFLQGSAWVLSGSSRFLQNVQKHEC